MKSQEEKKMSDPSQINIHTEITDQVENVLPHTKKFKGHHFKHHIIG